MILLECISNDEILLFQNISVISCSLERPKFLSICSLITYYSPSQTLNSLTHQIFTFILLTCSLQPVLFTDMQFHFSLLCACWTWAHSCPSFRFPLRIHFSREASIFSPLQFSSCTPSLSSESSPSPHVLELTRKIRKTTSSSRDWKRCKNTDYAFLSNLSTTIQEQKLWWLSHIRLSKHTLR